VGYASVVKHGCTFIRLAVDATKISLRNHMKFEVIAVQGHPKSSTLMPIEAHIQLPISH